jgi:ribulose-phosphate 3-epimerase
MPGVKMTETSQPFSAVKKQLPVVAPSILSADFGSFAREVTEIRRHGARLLHLDVMDGHFVPNITFGPKVVRAVRDIVDLPLDVHLMIESPERYIEEFVEAGSSLITVHAEASVHLHRTIQRIHQLGVAAGVSINPATPLSAVEEIVREVDLLLVMTVNPGFGGQKFIDHGLDKLSRAKQMLDEAGSAALLEADGGVGPENAFQVAAAGVDVLVAGSAVFGAEDRGKALAEICDKADEGFSSRRTGRSSLRREPLRS